LEILDMHHEEVKEAQTKADEIHELAKDADTVAKLKEHLEAAIA
jgi:hypothetical protein